MTFDLDGNTVDDFELKWGDNFEVQLHPGEEANMSFKVHVLQDEEMTPGSYSFTIQLVAIQWNMY